MRIKLCSHSTDLKNYERIKIWVKNHLYEFSFERQKKKQRNWLYNCFTISVCLKVWSRRGTVVSRLRTIRKGTIRQVYRDVNEDLFLCLDCQEMTWTQRSPKLCTFFIECFFFFCCTVTYTAFCCYCGERRKWIISF